MSTTPVHADMPVPAAAKAWIRLATSAPLLVVLGGVLAIGSTVTMTRYLIDLDRDIGRGIPRRSGDFMAFYTGGTLIHSGRGRLLYDLQEQHAVQVALYGATPETWQPFVNPPLLALAMAPVSGLRQVPALLLFNAVMVASFAAVLLLLRRCCPALAARPAIWWAAVLLVSSFHPLVRTLLSGQNTPLTLLLLTATFVALRSGHRAWAGVALGLLAYKPQFCPLIGLYLILQRDLRTLVWAAATAAAHYGLAALYCGPDWPLAMYRALQVYGPLERAGSYHTHIALLPACQFALPAPWALIVPAALIAAVAITVIRYARGISPDHPRFAALWALLVCGTMLASPHLQFYDAGLLVLPALLALDHVLRHAMDPSPLTRVLLAAGYLLFPAYELVDLLGFQPLVLWPALMFVWVASLLVRNVSERPPLQRQYAR